MAMMFENIERLFNDLVLMSYRDYLETKKNGQFGRSQDMRSAIQAATAAYHFREHIGRTQQDTRSRCSDYGLLGDVVNASKHRDLTIGNPQISGVSAIKEMLVATVYRDEMGKYYHNEKAIEIRLNDGTVRDLDEVLRNVVNFWLEELKAMGSFSTAKPFQPPSPQPIPRSESTNGRMDLISTAGLMESFSFRLQQFNYKTGQIDPMDLSGAKATFRAFSSTVDVDVKVPVREKIFTKSLSVDEELAEKLFFAKSEEEREQLVKGTQQFKDLVGEVAAEAGCCIALNVPIGERAFTTSIWLEGETAKQIALAENDEARRCLIGKTQQFHEKMTEIATKAGVELSELLRAYERS